ncbi:histidine kinase N-terminal 7TM domain-containing protein [Haloarculaceae archaeon H-GB2-1]|nr:histidine kinase N-terminal 7TM domain-containing protein [Haloarculaceae archaeon H-GB11]MEA5408861.1 histidine kinase N-terminal 7TM domain-containing protein [Haloarculaceae archaeon H-GB2-1]
MIGEWLTPTVASALMLTGVVPTVLNVYLLYDHRRKPGVLWFLVSMILGGVWALLFATFTFVSDPGLTMAIANFFWIVPPAASVSMFLLAYEYVSSKSPPTVLVGLLTLPILVLFGLSWSNPHGLVFTPAYHVDSAGILQFPSFGGPVKVLVVKVYGYLLFTLSAGILLGEVVRTTGKRRIETAYILLVFSTLALSTLVKVANLVPIYFDPTTVVFSLSGLAFAVSTKRRGFLKIVTIAREQAFEQVEDAIIITDSDGVVVDANNRAKELFGNSLVNERFESVLGEELSSSIDSRETVSISDEGERNYYSIRRSPVTPVRGTDGQVVVLSDITAVKNREQDLDLFKQVLTRIFRHNIRNDLNVISAYADLIASNTNGTPHDHATRIQSAIRGLLEKTTKAKEIEAIFTHETTQELSLRDLVENVVDDFDSSQSAATIRTTIPDYHISAHPKLELAVRELVENAIVHAEDGADPTVEIYTEDDGEMVTLFVEDGGREYPSPNCRCWTQSKRPISNTGQESDCGWSTGS